MQLALFRQLKNVLNAQQEHILSLRELLMVLHAFYAKHRHLQWRGRDIVPLVHLVNIQSEEVNARTARWEHIQVMLLIQKVHARNAQTQHHLQRDQRKNQIALDVQLESIQERVVCVQVAQQERTRLVLFRQ
jgi:hypothetical protein